MVDDSANNRTIITAITPDWINVKSATYAASGVTTSTTGSITASSSALTVASSSSWAIGQGIRVFYAGSSAGTTTLSSALGISDTSVHVASTSSFPSYGKVKIGSEVIYYGSKTSTRLHELIRGADGTTAASHLINANVVSQVDLVTTITAINGTTLTLSNAASITVTSVRVEHDDTAAIQQAINDGISNARPVYIPKGTYLVSGLSAPGGAILIGDGPQLSIISSWHASPIINCPRATNDAGPYAYQGARLERVGVLGRIDAGLAQVGVNCDDPVYALGHYLDDLRVIDCGGAGVYIGLSFSSHFEKIWASNCNGFNFKINSPNMPCITLHQCNTGAVRSAAPVGFRIISGSIRLESCNGIYGGDGTDWWGVVGAKVGLYGDDVNATAYVQFVNCNFESNTVGGIRFLNNSRGDFDGCTWVGDVSATNYKALLYDVDLKDRTATTGSITSGTNQLTVANAGSFASGQSIIIAGAGSAGGNLTATISSISGKVFTLGSNASTTVTDAAVTHNDDIFFPWEGPKGYIDDSCLFTQSPASFYANSQPIHISSFPTNGAAYPPIQVLGNGPKISGVTGFIATYYNDSTAASGQLIRVDANAAKRVITASTTFNTPGIRYIECNHTGAITITLPWPAAYSNIGQPVTIKDISSAGAATNNITINASSGGTVNGSSYVISQSKGSVTLIPDGVNDWRVVSEYKSASLVPIILPDGSTSSLAIQRQGDSDTGVYIDANGWYFVKDGSEYARIKANDNWLKGVLRITTSGLGQSYITVDNEDLWLQFNNTLRWVFEKGGRVYPAGQNTQDLGYLSGGELRTGYFGTSIQLGISSNITGTAVFRNSTNSFLTTLRAGAASASWTLTLPTTAGTNGQVFTTDGAGNASWTTPSAASGANTALSNLASVAINTSLLPDTDNSLDLGSNSFSFRDAYLDRDIYVGRRIQSLLGTAPTYTTNQGAGTSPTISINGNDVCGSIIITTGTSPAASTTIIVLTFSTSFIRPNGYGRPILILQPGNAAAASLSGAQQIFVNESVSVGSSTQVTITSNSTALAAGTEYRWLYHVIGQGALVPGG